VGASISYGHIYKHCYSLSILNYLIVVVSEIKSEVQRKNTDPLLDLSALKDGNLIEVCLFVHRFFSC